MDVKFEFKGDQLATNLLGMEKRAKQAIMMYANTAAMKLQNSARQKAPWTDRTGHARQRLECTVSEIPTGAKLALAHGVDYGVFLELANEKRFAIVEPTIRLVSPEIMEGFENLMDKMGYARKG